MSLRKDSYRNARRTLSCNYARTDGLGEFNVPSVGLGRYLVEGQPMALARQIGSPAPSTNSDEAEPRYADVRTYYPGVARADAAALVDVHPGDAKWKVRVEAGEGGLFLRDL